MTSQKARKTLQIQAYRRLELSIDRVAQGGVRDRGISGTNSRIPHFRHASAQRGQDPRRQAAGEGL